MRPDARRFFFVQISDPQFGMYGPPDEGWRESPLFATAIARINALAPAFVVCSGDLIDRPGADDELDEARRLLAALAPGIPFHAVPGNHDVGDAPAPALLAWYRRRVGPDRFAFSHGGRRFIALNSCLLVDGTRAAAEADAQDRWLRAALAAPGQGNGAPPVVLMHHPLFLERPDEPDGYFNVPGPARAACLELLRRHGVETVLAGHLHRCARADDAGLEVVVTGPVGMPLGDGCSGLRIVKVTPDGLDHRYFALEDAAGQADFAAS